MRTAVKLLPWQLAHLALNRAVGVGVARSPRLAAAGFGLSLAMTGASVTLAASRSDGRALHDLAAGTRVVATTPKQKGTSGRCSQPEVPDERAVARGLRLLDL